MCCHLLGRTYWLKGKRGHEQRDLEQREQEWVEGTALKGGRDDCESLQFRHKLYYWAMAWQSDKGNRMAVWQASRAAMVTAARLALGEGHEEAASTLLSGKEHLLAWIHSQIKWKGWFQVVQNLGQLVHVQVLKCQIQRKLQKLWETP